MLEASAPAPMLRLGPSGGSGGSGAGGSRSPGWGSGIVGVAAAVGTGLFGRAWENDAPRAGLVQR
ncbi:hypothetical protein ADL05_04700, partial [Nocardiopsis sp. NRRL B-16309]